MNEWKKTGVLSLKDISDMIPPQERLEAGPVAILECIERIPCNPCVDACPFDAITIEGSMVERPTIDFEKCTGCGKCVPVCPGLAIFLVDFTHSDQKANLLLPYELLTLPSPDDQVKGVDRKGESITDAQVLKVKRKQGTGLINIAVDKDLAMQVRNIEVSDG